MVVLTQEFHRREMAQRIIMSLQVPERTIESTEAANPEVDWLGVVYALDRVFLSHGGSMGQHRFLGERSESLGGRTPVEVLELPGGPDRFCAAASAFAARTRSSAVI
ncbi:MAG TPA: hypothetical protein VHT25_03890 [Solirubrobacteraceae bacterium]|jgi:hypothetical protein|nr:hypothetical protein [Solirubrobacteraceae bacterium]